MPVTTVPYCNNCGEEIAADQQFCSSCGEPVGGGPGQETDRGAGWDDDTDDTGWDDEPNESGWDDEQSQGNREQNTRQGSRQRQGQRGGPQERRGGPQGEPGGRQRQPRGQPPGQQGEGKPPYPRIPRKGALDTVKQSFDWLTGFPILVGVFIVAHAIDAFSSAVPAGLGFLFTIGGFLATTFVGGMAYVFAERTIRDQPVDHEYASGIVRDRFLTLILVSIVYTIAVFIGLILLIIPGIYIGARLSPALPASVLDNYDVSDSLSVGWDIGQGNVLKLFGIFLFIVIVPALLFSGLVASFGLDVAENPVFILALSPVGAVFSAIGELALARVYIENY